MPDSLVALENVTKVFGDDAERAMSLVRDGASKEAVLEETGCTVAVRGVSVEVADEETFVIMGRSGSGKSTLLRCINRLVEPTEGSIRVGGEDVTAMSRERLRELCRTRMAMVFQRFGLFPHRTVAGNVAYGLEVSGVGKAEREERVAGALEQVGLQDYADHRPDALSGGMQQRVGLARALATDPDILLMDEPFSALDPMIRRELQDELLRLQRRHSRTVLFITHDLDEALRLGDRIAILDDGAVVQVGTPLDIITAPADDHVRRFVQDVDRTQVLTAGLLARELDGRHDAANPDALPTVSPDTTLADVLPTLLRADTVAVRDDTSLLGTLSRDDVAGLLEGRV
jgi:glycine betaine/proline transport system ATP-binding protein